ncbi:MAG: hypothetical protein ACOZBL_01590 [Patescibacteria group bacterium]
MSSTRSPCGSITQIHSQFHISCLAMAAIYTDLPQPDFQII